MNSVKTIFVTISIHFSFSKNRILATAFYKTDSEADICAISQLFHVSHFSDFEHHKF